MSSKLKCAIIGAGNIAAHHLKAWQETEKVDVVGICRRDEQKAKAFAEQHNIQYTTDYQDYFNNPDIDIIDIVLPSGLHADIGIQAAEAGKHVIVEKPIDVTLEKADALIDACKENNVTLSVISQYRYMDGMLKMYDVLEQGKLGKLIQGDAYIKWFRPQAYYDSGAWRGTWALDGGGPFMNQGIHFIDLLLSAMGPVKSVYAKTQTLAHDIEVEDNGVALVEFQSGALGVIEASTAAFPGLPAKLDIHGTKGTLSIEGDKLAFMQIEGEEAQTEDEMSNAGASDPLNIDVTPFVRQFQNILTAIENNTEPMVSGAVARKPLELILALYESAQTGKPVELRR